MKTQLALLTALALLLAACDQPAPKNEKPAAAQNNKTTETGKTPQPNSDNKADKPATDTKTGNKAPQPNSDNKNNTPAADTKTGDKPATSDSKTDTPADNKDQPKDEAPATPAPPPTFKTAAEALPYLESLLPYDIADSHFHSVSLDNNTYTFTAVIKGVEDAAAFQAGHDMAALQTAYRKGSLPYLCAQEPFATLWAKKKIRNIHLDYQDEHGNPIMQNDIDAAACTDVEAPATPITPKLAPAAAG